jgi:conjugative transposon TraN protein
MLHFIKNNYTGILFATCFAMVSFVSYSQAPAELQSVEVTFNKTSSIVFSAAITSVDRGSRDVLAQKAKGVNNVLQLKAGKINFKETNLTVITADGKLHHFFVSYADHPAGFKFLADSKDESAKSYALQFKSEMTDAELEKYSEEIVANNDKRKLKRTSAFDMTLLLKGIYIQNNIMFYYLRIENKTNIPYHPEMLRFYVRDKQKAKRTASQEVTERPIYQYGNSKVIEGQSTVDLVCAIPKFTIPDAKLLNIELMEQRGGRHLKLQVKNKMIVKAQPVPTE